MGSNTDGYKPWKNYDYGNKPLTGIDKIDYDIRHPTLSQKIGFAVLSSSQQKASWAGVMKEEREENKAIENLERMHGKLSTLEKREFRIQRRIHHE